jgi:uncharacterized protein YjbI with pentapeptide repeats
MTAEELLQRYATGERDFSGVDLSGVSLSEASLSEINLTNADLSSTDLTGIDLTGADLNGSNLMYSKLRGAKLIGCKFNGTNLLEVEWRTTDFTNVNLSGAINFYSGLFENVLLRNTTMPDGNVIIEETSWEA